MRNEDKVELFQKFRDVWRAIRTRKEDLKGINWEVWEKEDQQCVDKVREEQYAK